MLQRIYENGQRCEYKEVTNPVIVKVNLEDLIVNITLEDGSQETLNLGKKLDEMFQLNRFDYMLQMFEQLDFRIQSLIKEHDYIIIQE